MIKVDIDERVKVKNIQDLLEIPHIVKVNKFDEAGFKESFNKALNTKQPIIPVVIDSYGGQVYSLLGMADVIKSSPVPVATIVEGKAMSCGADLFSCGTEGYRFMGPNATLMIHDAANHVWGKVEEVKAEAKETDRLNQLVFKMMARNVSKPENYFLDIIHNKGHIEWYLGPDEAKEHNLANHIRLPNFKMKLSLDVSFE